MIRVALVLLALAAASPAFAADPECLPGPDADTPADLTKPYVRPNRDVRFCSSAVPEGYAGAVICEAVLGTETYGGPIEVQPLTVVRFSNPTSVAGPMRIRCYIVGTDPEGNSFLWSGETPVFDYNPEPVPEPPVPLLD